MFARITLAAVSVVSLASVVSAAPRLIVTGSHNPAQAYIVVDRVEEARPYTLAPDARRMTVSTDTSVRVGNRTVVPATR